MAKFTEFVRIEAAWIRAIHVDSGLNLVSIDVRWDHVLTKTCLKRFYLPEVSFCFGCHPGLPQLYERCGEKDKFERALGFGFVMALIIYCGIGALAYWRYGAARQSEFWRPTKTSNSSGGITKVWTVRYRTDGVPHYRPYRCDSSLFQSVVGIYKMFNFFEELICWLCFEFYDTAAYSPNMSTFLSRN